MAVINVSDLRNSGRESAHLCFEKFEPTHVGCYEPETVHGPNACARAKGGSPRSRRLIRSRFVLQRMDQALENQTTIRAAEDGFTGAFGMRHQAGHIAPLIADAGDVPQRTVWIRRVGDFSLRV